MIDYRSVLYVLGRLIVLLAIAMCIPALVDVATGHEDWQVFAAATAFTAFVGVSLELTFRGIELRLGIREGFLLTALSWMSLSALGALPFAFSELEMSYVDAVFETVSGLTTTGATVISGLHELPAGLHLWRAMLQWYGGIGIIVVAILVLPFLRVGGMQLFHTESSDRSEKAVPRLSSLISTVGSIYLGLTFACAIAYGLAGMSLLDAVVHAMTTVATAGFSTYDASIGHFDNPHVEWIAIVFMLSGAVPFVLYVRTLRGEAAAFLRDGQVRAYLTFLGVVVAAVAAWLVVANSVHPVDALRLSAFNVVSIATTTGYATADYGAWGEFSLAVFMFLMLVGGCYGSSAGGIKVFRWQISWQRIRMQIRRLLQPHSVISMHYQGRPVPEDVPGSVTMFIFVYLAGVVLFTLVFSIYGLDFITAFSSALSAFGNIGPGLGAIVGPAGNFAVLPAEAKWVMSLAMIAGRLELFAILVLFSRRFWRG